MESNHSPNTETAKQIYVASTLRRLLAIIVDTALGIIIFFPLNPNLMELFSTAIKDGSYLIPWSVLLIQFVVAIGIFGILLKTKGGTPGKLILGLRVISTSDTSLLSWKQAYGRLLVPYLNLVIGIIPYAIAFFNKERRQLADLICGTRVIQASPRSPVKIRWLIGGFFVLNGLWYIYQLPNKAKLFSLGPKGITVKSSLPKAARTSNPKPNVIIATDLRCFELGFHSDATYSADEKRNKVRKTVQIIANRLQELEATNIGVSYPSVQNDRLLVKASSSSKDILSLISKRGMLAMHAIDNSISTSEIENLISKLSSEHPKDHEIYFEEINRFATGKIPNDRIIMFYPHPNMGNKLIPYLVNSEVIYDSSDVTRVELKDSSSFGSQVFTQLSPKGASKVEQFTAANIGESVGIAIDNEIKMVAPINGKISDGLIPLWGTSGSADEILKQAIYLRALLFDGPLPLTITQSSEIECKEK